MRSFVIGIPSIKFSERINQLLIKDMSFTMMIKLLGRSMGYATLQIKIYALWKPSQPFSLMDTANVYFFGQIPKYERLRTGTLLRTLDHLRPISNCSAMVH